MTVLYKETLFTVELTRIGDQQLLIVQFDLSQAECFTAWMLALAEGFASELILRSERVKLKTCLVIQESEERIDVKDNEVTLHLGEEKVRSCAWSFLKMVASEHAFPDHVDLDIINSSGAEDTVTFKVNR